MNLMKSTLYTSQVSNLSGFNRYTLLNLHALLCDNLLEDPTASGRLRTIPVGIGHTTFLPLEGPQRIEECFDQVMDTAAAIRDPFEQAFFAMVLPLYVLVLATYHGRQIPDKLSSSSVTTVTKQRILLYLQLILS